MNSKNDYSSKFEIFQRASMNFDDDNVMLQFQAIRLIAGLSKDNPDFLVWMCEYHFDVVKETVKKLTFKSLNDNDIAIINEAKAVIEILGPYLDNPLPVIKFQCVNCGNEIDPGWNNCTACGADIQWGLNHFCPNCRRAINPCWKLCPECGHDLKQQYCSGCKNKLESSWKLCPYCGVQTPWIVH